MSNKKRNIYKVKYEANVKQQDIRVWFHPSIQDCTLEDTMNLANALMSGTQIAYQKVLQGLPLLRPATNIEREAKIYVFVDEEQDNKLYKQRNALYQQMQGQFQAILSGLFPDIEYINQARQHQQEIIFEMSQEEAAEHKANIQMAVAEVKQKLKEEEEEAENE